MDMCFTSLTVSVDCDPPAADEPDGLLLLDPAADGADGEVMPLI